MLLRGALLDFSLVKSSCTARGDGEASHGGPTSKHCTLGLARAVNVARANEDAIGQVR